MKYLGKKTDNKDIATQDDFDSYVTTNTAQTVSGAKTFSSPVVVNSNETYGLEVNSTSKGGYLKVQRGTGNNAVTMAIKSGSSGGTFGTVSNHQFQFRTNDTARMVIGTDGSVVLSTDIASASDSNQVATTKWTNSKLADKQELMATPLTEDLVLMDGTPPSLSDGIYYTGNYKIHINSESSGEAMGIGTKTIFSLYNNGHIYQFNKLYGPGYAYGGIYYEPDPESTDPNPGYIYTQYWGNYIKDSQKYTIMPTNPTLSRYDNFIPSLRLMATQLDTKQNTLTAGTNISISGNTISATDTTYSAFTGTDGTSAGTAGLVPAPATTDTGKFLKADGTWATAGGGTSDYNSLTNKPSINNVTLSGNKTAHDLELQAELATPLTVDIYLVDGTAPTLADGTYYTGTHKIYVNGTEASEFNNVIFSLEHDEYTYNFIKIYGTGYQSASISCDIENSNEYTYGYTNPVLQAEITKSMPPNVSSAIWDKRVPSTKLFKTQLDLKANTSGLGSLASMSSIDYTSNYITNKPSLATVATSGSYNDLSNKPTIPSSAADVGAMPASSVITAFWTGTQAEYDLLTPDSTTLYLIHE